MIPFIESRFISFSRQIWLVFVLLPSLSLVLNAAIAIKNGIPIPRVQDEFSYLLAGDTFAHGRLTNPTPACWEHFETPQELVRPSYMSKYPPGQGLVLALGQVMAGLPIFGIWISTALGCAAIYWMLLAVVSRGRALWGGVVALIHPQLIHWSQIYWGGSVAVLGGAVVLGAWLRLMKRATVGLSCILGIGLAILAVSRPYEGIVFSTPLMVLLVWKHRLRGLVALGIGLAVILLPAGAMMGYFNFRVTGHVLRMPFDEYARQYDIYPKFWFMPTHAEPAYRNDSMRTIATVFEHGEYDQLRTAGGLVRISIGRICTMLSTFAKPWVLLVALTGVVPASIRDRSSRWLLLVAGVFQCGLWAENFFLPHYAAPVGACFILLIIIGWRWISELQMFHRSVGKCVSIAIGIAYVIYSSVLLAAPLSADSKRVGHVELVQQRAQLQSGRHLIFVRYLPGHLMHDEWVYNDADINGQRIIWTRFMGTTQDEPVIRQYGGRQAWLLIVGEKDLSLNPYPPSP